MGKQNLIIDAALKTFAMHGYKKTSISDIASTAGISKAMVFHYFGTKKELYLYLVNTCVDSINTEVVEKFDDSITDLFDRILHTSKLELTLMEKHPNVPSFIHSAYFENDVITVDREEIRVGSYLPIKGKSFASFGYIVAIER
jgi:TetR/AcrR family transcriptional regulator